MGVRGRSYVTKKGTRGASIITRKNVRGGSMFPKMGKVGAFKKYAKDHEEESGSGVDERLINSLANINLNKRGGRKKQRYISLGA